MRAYTVRFRDDEGGATAIEYALLASLIAVLIVAALTVVGQNTEALYDGIATALT